MLFALLRSAFGCGLQGRTFGAESKDSRFAPETCQGCIKLDGTPTGSAGASAGACSGSPVSCGSAPTPNTPRRRRRSQWAILPSLMHPWKPAQCAPAPTRSSRSQRPLVAAIPEVSGLLRCQRLRLGSIIRSPAFRAQGAGGKTRYPVGRGSGILGRPKLHQVVNGGSPNRGVRKLFDPRRGL